METKKNKALIALDESEESFYALKWALEHVLREDDSVILLHSQAHPPSYMVEPAPRNMDMRRFHVFGTGVVMPPELLVSFRKQQEHVTNTIFSKAKKLCEEHKVNTKTMVAQGDPRDNICEAVVNNGVDMLIMGSHGYGAIKRTFLGSVSDYCAHNVKCPVLIVKKEKEKKSQ